MTPQSVLRTASSPKGEPIERCYPTVCPTGIHLSTRHALRVPFQGSL